MGRGGRGRKEVPMLRNGDGGLLIMGQSVTNITLKSGKDHPRCFLRKREEAREDFYIDVAMIR